MNVQRVLGIVWLAGAIACANDSTPPETEVAVTTVAVSPGNDTLELGETSQLVATPRDVNGGTLSRTVTWTSNNNTVATVSQTGLVTAVGRGTATITATARGVEGKFTVTVTLPISTVAITPASPVLEVGATVQLVAVPKDSLGNILTGVATWQSSDTLRAVVNAEGLVTTRELGAVTITATIAGRAGTASLTIQVAWQRVSAARFMACGLAITLRAYCWGSNVVGELGNGSADTSHRNIPVRVAGNITFSQVVAAGAHACGISSGGAAYCWGYNVHGQLGTGSNNYNSDRNPSPALVVGGRTFTAITGAYYHTCALTSAAEIYCWGSNVGGLLGSPTTESCTVNQGGSPLIIPCSTSPRLVAGGLAYSAVSAGNTHTCALSTTGAAYCWGLNHYGQLGIGAADTVSRNQPTAVVGGRTYTAITSGGTHSCGIATGGAAYCWGMNFTGALGVGTSDTLPHPTPLAVTGGHSFVSISAGESHTCGVTTGGANYCWGENLLKQLGSVTTTTCEIEMQAFACSPIPVEVSGPVKFTQMSASLGSTCGLSTSRGIYCWGSNSFGRLGTGNNTNSAMPVPVYGSVTGSTSSVFPATAGRRTPTASVTPVYQTGRHHRRRLPSA